MEPEEEALQTETYSAMPRNRFFTFDPYMLPAKAAYFINNARYSIGDFMVIFYVQAGLSPFEAGLVNGLQHVGGMIAAPLFGLLADKYGFHRLITICLCGASIIAMCIQPYFTTSLGDEDKNFCPAKTFNTSNSTISNHDGRVSGKIDNQLFFSLFTSAILASSFDGSIMSFNEVGVLTRVQNSPSESSIGVQRIMAALGSSLGSLAYSFSVHYFAHGNLSCYVGLFVTYFILALCLAVSFHFLFKGLKIKKEQRSANVTKELILHLKKIRSVVFLFTVLFNGTVPAIMFSYLFLFLNKYLNGSTLIVGVSISFDCISGIIIYAFSSKLIKLLGGPMNAMCASSLAWAIRLLAIAYLVNPYYVLLIDVFHGLTFSLFKVASLEYVKEETDVAILSSMLGVVNALSYSCSFLLANIVGGKIYELYGPRKLFLGLSVTCVIWTVLMLFYIILTNKNPGRNDEKEIPLHHSVED